MPGALLGPFGRYELGAEIVTIGRSSANKLVINDNLVSGRHLQVMPQGADYLLVDIGSSNGTTLNGQRLPPQMPQPLRSGDVIVIGSTRLTVELAAFAFPAAPGPAPQGEIIIAPPQQAAAFPSATDDPIFPPYPPPGPATPNYGGPAPQGTPFPPAAPAPQGTPFPFAAPTPQGFPFPPAAPAPQGGPFPPVAPTPQGGPFPPVAPTPFGPYPGNPPGQAPIYQPGFGPPGAAPPPYGGAPGAGVGFPPARTRAKRNRTLLVIGAVVALVLILGVTALIFLKFTGSHITAQGTPTPAATQQVIMPFYEDLKNQEYMAAANLFTTSYLARFGGVDAVANNLKTISDTLGQVISYSIKTPSGSNQTQTAMVQVKRAPVPPASGTRTFKPDILELAFDASKQIWQINNWMPGQPQG